MKTILAIFLFASMSSFAMECKMKAQDFAKREAHKTLRDIGTVDLVETKIIHIEHMYYEEYEVTVNPFEYHGPELESLTYFVKLMVQPNCEVVESKLIE